MKKQLTRIAPLRAGIVLGILYGIIGLLAVPVVLFWSMGSKGGFGGALFAVFVPVLYAVIGFIGGIISAATYNLVAKWTGGLEFEVRDIPSAS